MFLLLIHGQLNSWFETLSYCAALEGYGNNTVYVVSNWNNTYTKSKSKTVTFLKDVSVNCKETELRGTRVENAAVFKELVGDYIDKNHLEAAIYHMHGYNVSPWWSVKHQAVKFKDDYEKLTNMLLIPILWRNAWGSTAGSYEYDRNNPSIRAGKLFAEQSAVFNTTYTTHIIVSIHTCG